METTLRLKVSDLNLNIINSIKGLFKDDREITLTISSATDFELNKTEAPDEYFKRLKKAIKNLDKGKSVSFKENELNEFVMQNLQR
ncbi:MAG: hypothetical protein ABI723_03870 [Bacteroidia bacterium]